MIFDIILYLAITLSLAFIVATTTEESALGASMIIWPVAIPALLFIRFCEWAADLDL